MDHGRFWRNRELRKHLSVIEGETAPTIVFTNSTYLNVYTKQWLNSNIWIYNDRIVYVGDRFPKNIEGTEVIDCTGQYLVPGYIEPHSHPFQLYNPEELAHHAAKYGTTTLINDNIRFLRTMDIKKAFTLINEFHQLPSSMFWWARYDAQTALRKGESQYSHHLQEWLENPSIVQGGELTAWPSLLDGDDQLLYWIQETKRLNKPVEGHLPGASKETLTKLKLLGVSGEHEAMTGEDVIKRLELGYQVTLRNSSIRPDLSRILDELNAKNLQAFDSLMMTTDGSSPRFYKDGLMNICIDIAIKSGVPIIDAYRMATYNPARHFGLDEVVGSIAPGRFAHINVLYEKDDPHPLSVLAKGEWVVKDGAHCLHEQRIDWDAYDLSPEQFTWDLNRDDLQFSIPIGLKMINDVVMKPYAVEIDITAKKLPNDNLDAFLLMVDRFGKWRVNTVIHGFTERLGGLASSFSTTGDLIFIGKNQSDIVIAWNRLKEIGGGIVLVHDGEIIYELPLQLRGVMYVGGMNELIQKETELKDILVQYGYQFNDPAYNLLFLSSTHLPYIRITQQGIYDVMRREVIVPANMR